MLLDLQLWFLYKVYRLLTWVIVYCDKHQNYVMAHKVYCYRVYVDKKMVAVALRRHIRKNWR